MFKIILGLFATQRETFNSFSNVDDYRKFRLIMDADDHTHYSITDIRVLYYSALCLHRVHFFLIGLYSIQHGRSHQIA